MLLGRFGQFSRVASGFGSLWCKAGTRPDRMDL